MYKKLQKCETIQTVLGAAEGTASHQHKLEAGTVCDGLAQCAV